VRDRVRVRMRDRERVGYRVRDRVTGKDRERVCMRVYINIAELMHSLHDVAMD
jgi:hypothetical protein